MTAGTPPRRPPAKVRVAKAASRTKVTVAPKALDRGDRTTARPHDRTTARPHDRTTVTGGSGVQPTGTVKVVAARQTRVLTLEAGKAAVRLARFARASRVPVTVVYPGNGTHARSTATAYIRGTR